MSLRKQLLLVSLLLLSLPWAGCQFVREMEGALRYGQEQSMQATTQAIAAVLNHQPQLLYPTIDRLSAVDDAERSIYADTRHEPIIVDFACDKLFAGFPDGGTRACAFAVPPAVKHRTN